MLRRQPTSHPPTHVASSAPGGPIAVGLRPEVQPHGARSTEVQTVAMTSNKSSTRGVLCKPAKRAKLEDQKEGTTSPLDLAQLKHYGENSKVLVDGLVRRKTSLATKI